MALITRILDATGMAEAQRVDCARRILAELDREHVIDLTDSAIRRVAAPLVAA